LNEEFVIADTAGRLLLETAAFAYDRMTNARKQIEKEGMLVKDRRGGDIQHPLLRIERDARSSLLLALKHLKLDIEPPPER
jgi:phage terminase small subunit